jgi:LuxR family transcriptional regulator, maltose regulon positive regulatory protein
VLARVLLAQHKPHQLLTLLERLHAQAEAEGRTGSLVEARALLALGLVASGDQAAGLSALAEALAIAAHEGYVRVFVDEGPQWAAYLPDSLPPTARARPRP